MTPLPLHHQRGDCWGCDARFLDPFECANAFSHTSRNKRTFCSNALKNIGNLAQMHAIWDATTWMWIVFFLNLLSKISICMKKRIISENLELLEKSQRWEMHFFKKKGGNMVFIIFVSETEERWTAFFTTKSLIINARFKKKKKKKANVAAITRNRSLPQNRCLMFTLHEN